MSVVAVTSSRTSPGATTLAAGLALSWSHAFEQALLIEADPAGGVLSLRFELGVAPSLTTFGSDSRNGYAHELVWSNTQDLRGVRCMPAPVDPRLARSWTERVTPLLVEHLPTLGAPAVIDLGWLGEDGASLPLAQAADMTLVVTRPHIAEVQALLFQVRQLRAAGANVALVSVGDKPNDPQEIASLAGVPLAAVLPDDAHMAAALAGGKFAPKRFQRSMLWRTIGGLAASLIDEHVMLDRHVVSGNDDAAFAPQPQAVASVPVVLEPVSEPETHIEPAAPVLPVPTVEVASAPIVETVIAPVASSPRRIEIATTGSPLEISPIQSSPAKSTTVGSPDLVIEPTVCWGAHLVLADGDLHTLETDALITVGRHRECDVVIADAQVSRHHGTFSHTPNGWQYIDHGSRNGSTINGRPCVQTLLRSGDEVSIGRVAVIFQTVSPELASHELALIPEREYA